MKPITAIGGAAMSRRTVLAGAGACLLPVPPALAQDGAMDLPFRATLLEHMGSVVPDVTASARFHSRLFNPAIRTEQQPVPLRYYVDLNGGYLAFGSREGEETAFFDHFCALIADYSPDGAAVALESQGVEVAASWGTFGLFQDPDGIGVQLVADPGGWFPTVIDAEPLVEGPPIVTPRGLDHVVLGVSDIGAGLDFYRTYFGPESESADDGGTVWFAMSDTRLGVRPAENGAEPGIVGIGVKTEAFDREAVGAELLAMGAQITDGDEGGRLRFLDPDGLALALVPEGA